MVGQTVMIRWSLMLTWLIPASPFCPFLLCPERGACLSMAVPPFPLFGTLVSYICSTPVQAVRTLSTSNLSGSSLSSKMFSANIPNQVIQCKLSHAGNHSLPVPNYSTRTMAKKKKKLCLSMFWWE